MALWSRYPGEIEADLRFRGVRIADWHQGTRDERGALVLSSRQLLNLVRRLPEESEFKTHAAPPFGRDGDWPELKTMIAALHNETAANRASKYAGTQYEYSYRVFHTPLERREAFMKQAQQKGFAQEAQTDMFAQLGWG